MMLNHTLIDLGPPLTPAEACTVAAARGLVVLVHADGASVAHRRDSNVALRLQSREMSTVMLDLLTPEESAQETPAVDVEVLAQRLLLALDALPPEMRGVPLGLMASDSGAAAALIVAARRPQLVRAVVSRGGRADLAAEVLGDVRAPTLLLVGAADTEVLEYNRRAFARLRCEKRIDIVPRATHQFLEAGALEVVAHFAGDWFGTHLGAPNGDTSATSSS